MPSFIITVNNATEIRVNLLNLISTGLGLEWIGGDAAEDGLICFHVGGIHGEERVRWDTPELSVGDELTIKISEDSVVDSALSRSPFERRSRQ